MEKQIGPYRIEGEVGRGGMGVVYLAVDERLDREVAIKALPEDLATDAGRLERFEREAKVLAQLNHPNVAGIHGIEEKGGKKYLVLEYVEGETLAERLDHGSLGIEDALEFAVQIAAGVEAAHEAGIVHRDLKPSNIKITPEGQAKVLDFGLAKNDESALSSGSGFSQSPTLTSPIPQNSPTMPGAILGTAAYMSPEQARGRRVDNRTDIWAFGVILYEMLTGIGPFYGETATDSLGAVLHKDVELEQLPDQTPAIVAHLLRRCLQRDKRQRLQSIADARLDLEEAIANPGGETLGSVRAGQQAATRWLPSPVQLVAFAVILLATSAVVWVSKPVPPIPAQPVQRFTVAIPKSQGFTDNIWMSLLSISRDGSKIAFVGKEKGSDEFSNLYLRQFDQSEATLILETVNAYSPCFSPDGESIAYLSPQGIMRKSTRGGPSSTVCKIEGWVNKIDWGSDGWIYFTGWVTGGDRVSVLQRVIATGGTPEPLTSIEENSRVNHMLPNALPDGRGVIFTVTDREAEWDDAAIMVLPTGETEPRVLVTGGVDGRYVESGHLVYRSRQTLMAAPFDLEQLTVTGVPVPVLENISGTDKTGPTHIDVSSTGTLLYLSGDGSNQEIKSVSQIDMQGNIEPLSSVQGPYAKHSLSPDASHIAIVVTGDGDDSDATIQVLERRRELLRPLVTEYKDLFFPIWSPDQKWILFSAADDDQHENIFRVPADFSGGVEQLTTSEDYSRPSHFSPDGRTLAFEEYDQDSAENNIFLLRFDENDEVVGEPERVTNRSGTERGARFSPDGKWLAFRAKYADQRSHIFVRPVSGSGASVQVSIETAYFVRWSPAENRLFFSDWRVDEMYSATFSTENGVFTAELPEVLFELGVSREIAAGFEITPDGQYFTVLAPAEEKEEAEPVNPQVILNWFEELRAKVPTTGSD